MKTGITFEEKRYAKNLIKETKEPNSEFWGKWCGSALIALGGSLIVFIILFSLASPSTPNTAMVLISGTSNGVLLLFFGAYSLHVSKSAKEKRIIASLLQKLMP